MVSSPTSSTTMESEAPKQLQETTATLSTASVSTSTIGNVTTLQKNISSVKTILANASTIAPFQATIINAYIETTPSPQKQKTTKVLHPLPVLSWSLHPHYLQLQHLKSQQHVTKTRWSHLQQVQLPWNLRPQNNCKKQLQDETNVFL